MERSISAPSKITYSRLKKLDSGLLDITTASMKTDEQQTTPSRVKGTGAPKVQAQGVETNGTPGKRKGISPLQAEDQQKRKIKRRMKPNHLEPTDSEMETVLQDPVQETKDREWQKVEAKKTKRKKNKEMKGPKEKEQTKQRSRRLRPCALVIKPTEGKTYADVLSKVKKDTTLQDVSLAVAGVRKTLSGDVLLILNKDNQGKVTEIGQKIGTVLGEDATINTRIPEITLEVTRLDGTTTKDEVYQAVMRELGNGHSIAPEAVVSVRTTYGGMQTALLKLPAQAARKLLEKQTMRVNWSSVRVREVMRPTKCFRCWQYGHISKKCTSETDRSKCCIKCCKEGHKAETCTATTCCDLCKEAGNKETNHIPGTRKCPVYEKAYQHLLQKWH